MAEVRRAVHRRAAQVDATPCRARAGRARGPPAWRCRTGAARRQRYERPRRRSAPARCAWSGRDAPSVSWADGQRSPRSRRSTASRRAGPSAGRPTASTASTAPPTRADVFSIDTPPPTVSRLAPHGHRVRLHPDRRHRPLPADGAARRSSTRSAGTTTAWPPSAGCRTSTACAATRRCRTTPTSQPPFRGDAPKDHREVPISRPNFVELCHELTATDEAVFEDAVPPARAVVDWTLQYATIDDAQPAHQPGGVPAQPRPRRGLQRRGADAVGRRRPHGRRPGRDRGPRAARRLPPARVPRPRRRRASIDTTRPELLVSCVALVAHPDDERYQPLVRLDRAHAAVRRRGAVVAHPLAQPDKGTGIAMVCTFGDTTDVTWWRELDLPTRSVIGRDGRFVAATPAWLATDAGRGGLRRARRADRQAGPDGDRRAAAASRATCSASRGRSPTR